MENSPDTTNGIREKAHHLTDHIGDLLESYYKLGVLNLTDKATGIASVAITLVIVGFMGMFALLLIAIGFGYWLGERLDSMFAGFTLAASVCVTIIVIILVSRKQFLLPFLRNFIIRKIYE